MAEDVKPVEILEAQITALGDTHKNVKGAIEKLTPPRRFRSCCTTSKSSATGSGTKSNAAMAEY